MWKFYYYAVRSLYNFSKHRYTLLTQRDNSTSIIFCISKLFCDIWKFYYYAVGSLHNFTKHRKIS